MGWDEYIPNDDAYDYATFTIPDGTTDYDLQANQSDLFKNLRIAKGIVVKTDQPIGLRLNFTAMPLINITICEAPFEFVNKKLIRNGFLTNASGSDANIEIFLI